MSTKTTIQLIDDVDGSEAVESITFGVDGVIYEIDLNEENSARLRDEVFGAYIDAGRRTGRLPSGGDKSAMKRTQLPDARPGITKRERLSIQKWARAKGLDAPGDRGRVATRLVEGWTADGRPI